MGYQGYITKRPRPPKLPDPPPKPPPPTAVDAVRLNTKYQFTRCAITNSVTVIRFAIVTYLVVLAGAALFGKDGGGPGIVWSVVILAAVHFLKGTSLVVIDIADQVLDQTERCKAAQQAAPPITPEAVTPAS